MRCLDEMLCMMFSNILYYKVINNEGELYGSGFMSTELWDELNRLISVLLQVLFKYFMWNSSSLWKTVHDLSNINIDFDIVWNFSDVIFIDNFVRVWCQRAVAYIHTGWLVCSDKSFAISAHTNLTSGVDMVLLMRVLFVVISDVGFVN